ncbi:MAG: RNA 3'-phosphate cyclase [Planctomycetes bacterium]|nr:RNA 3'-phosphate cyclase [Planctomycetota bacterium]
MAAERMTIDGSFGEGGGQILRTSAALAAALGIALRVENFRASRPRPGLARQHLAALGAVAAVTGVELRGGELGSTAIELPAGRARAGEYRFEIGTAGSANLVVQTVLPVLLLADGDSRVTVTGGTHNPMAPCYHYLAHVMGPLMAAMGVDAMLTMERAGFYPAGGGELTLHIRGLGGREPLIGLRMTQRGELRSIDAMSAVSTSLPDHVAERQARQLTGRLQKRGVRWGLEEARWETASPGTVVFLRAVFARGTAGFFALGRRGKPAEAVADEAVDALEAHLDADGAVDPHAADQLLVPAALALEPTAYTTTAVTSHLLTNAEIVRRLTGRAVTVEGEMGGPGRVDVEGV